MPHSIVALIVKRALIDPAPDGVAIAGGELLRPMRHPNLLRYPPVEKRHQAASAGVASDHHRPELGPLHHAGIVPQVEAARFEALAAGCMALDAAPLEDRQHVLLETDRRRTLGPLRGLPLTSSLIRRQTNRGDRNPDNDTQQPSLHDSYLVLFIRLDGLQFNERSIASGKCLYE